MTAHRSTVIIAPGSPAIIDGLGSDKPSHELREIARECINTSSGAARIAIVGDKDEAMRTNISGSFQAWGAPQVQLGVGQYLPELIGYYLIGTKEQGKRIHQVEIKSYASFAEVIINPPELVLCILDGSAGLTARAPLALIDTAAQAHQWCCDLLATTSSSRQNNLEVDQKWLSERGVLAPQLWLELAQLTVSDAQLHYVDESLGVGRYVARWEVEW
ncbi:Uncharacterised protein [Corynebacterium kutscheri]|uniref:Uncharacterized protein n=1 Tax=Corynebacterium kutscheri TaxID=35755 RepID=A0A0F6R0P5_9CORY|nr:hypothetical protein [Corynebacterium kutscheri]AKE41405.1 hypothetical protein UL82_06195 [Corynebacterium kutscheri]VEH08682.1 Uncharacterised protein [Corynebacterium kutscheri]VEH09729.1 Uncharacterised protein [Corynebacterium kutscheri]VEH79812.1 Uncharacterised protein [Corynebacterium kutscheri]